MKAVYLPQEAVTEVLTALHGCKSQLGDVANLSAAIKLLETAEAAPENSPKCATEVMIRDTEGPWTEDRVDAAESAHFEKPDEEDMEPMPGAGLDIPDDKSGGLATMAKELLRGSSLGDRGRPKPRPFPKNRLEGY